MSDTGIVETCEDCSKLTGEFTELHRTLEMIELRMNWCLRKICDVITRSTAERSKSVESGLEDSRTRNFESLRRRTIINGRKRIRKTALPFISLKRVRLDLDIDSKDTDDEIPLPILDGPFEPEGNKDTPNIEEENISPPKCTYQPLTDRSTEEEVEQNQVQASACGLKLDHHPSEPVFVSLDQNNISEPDGDEQPLLAEEQLPKSKSSSSSSPLLPNRDLLSCPFCRATFVTSKKTVRSQQIHLSGHILQYHCEHFFPNQKLDIVTDSQYQQILVDLLFRDFYQEKSNHFNCPFCPRSFTCTAAKNKSAHLLRFKVHLLNMHREELDAKLFRIQSDPQLPEKLKTCNVKGVRCECGVYLSNTGSQQKHQKYHCTLFAPKIPNMISNDHKEESEKLKRSRCPSQEMLDAHKTNHCNYAFESFGEMLDLDCSSRPTAALPLNGKGAKAIDKSMWENENNNEVMMMDFNFSASDDGNTLIDPLA